MAHWVRFNYKNNECIGIQKGKKIEIYNGDIFNNPSKTEIVIDINETTPLNPCNPSKIIALWNNYKTLADEKGLSKPNNPLYLNKAISCILEPGKDIVRPKFYDEAIFYEGELGIGIGK